MTDPDPTVLTYPQARVSDHVDTLHGVNVPDPYRWMEEIDSEETREWIAAQNELTAGYLSGIPVREPIRRRVRKLWDFERFGVPQQRNGRLFFTRNDGLQNQPVLYWTDSITDESKPLLDVNALAADGTVALIDFSPSEDGKLLAYGLAEAGSDWQEWRIREVETGRDLAEVLRWTKFTHPAWVKDADGFFYSRFDPPDEKATYKAANYDQKLYYHRLGAIQDEDRLVYERPDRPQWRFFCETTQDGRYLVITVSKGTHRENGIFYLDLDDPKSEMVEFLSEFDAAYEFLGSDGALCYFLTNLDAPRSRVIGIDLVRPDRADWIEIIPESEDVLQAVKLVGGRFVATTLCDAHSRLTVIDTDGRSQCEVPLPGIGSVALIAGRSCDRHAYYLYTSFATPETVYRLDTQTGATTVFRRPQLPFSSDAYVTEQIFVESKDQTRFPLFISRKKTASPEGVSPTYLYGYGGYNIPLSPTFSPAHLAWMDMGGVYVQACLRGGGEYGDAWHEAGSKENRQNVFDDFIAAAEWLIANNVTTTKKLAIGGRSNGGLLVGACLTQRPNLYGACLPAVGVMDMLRFHKFTVGWGWVSDYGSPDESTMFEALHAYSPYHNIKSDTTYPPTLITTGDHDDRVYPAHSYKFAARLQESQAGPAPILIRIDTRAGHGLGKPTDKLIDEITDGWAFLWHALGGGPIG